MNSPSMRMSEQTSTPHPCPPPPSILVLAPETPKFALSHIYSLLCPWKPVVALVGNEEILGGKTVASLCENNQTSHPLRTHPVSCTMSFTPMICAPHIHPRRQVLSSLLWNDDTETEISKENNHQLNASYCRKGPRSQGAPALALTAQCSPEGVDPNSPQQGQGERKCRKAMESRVGHGENHRCRNLLFIGFKLPKMPLGSSFFIYLPACGFPLLLLKCHFVVIFLVNNWQQQIAIRDQPFCFSRGRTDNHTEGLRQFTHS